MTRTRRVDEPPLRLLFVCTANIARSPYAERRAAQLLRDRGPDGQAVRVASAGIPGFPGRGMDPGMAAQLRARGAELTGHVSRVLSRDLLAEAVLVLTFEFAHRLRIAEAWPDHAGKVFGLRQLADAVGRVPSPGTGLDMLDQAYGVRRPDGMNWDVTDPHGRGTAAARACAAQIDEALAVIIPALVGPPVGSA